MLVTVKVPAAAPGPDATGRHRRATPTSHETDESLDAIRARNPGHVDVAHLVEQYHNLRRTYDTLQEGIAHLLALGLIRREEINQVFEPPRTP